ncbi:MAG: Tex family protein [Lachnospirales bacterium]
MIVEIISKELEIKKEYVENIIALIDEGNTIPFIARYRKEMHGSLDDQKIRELSERLNYLRNFNDRRDTIRNTLVEMEKLTDDIDKALSNALTLTELEDIYRPFKPKKRTRATIAIEKGMEPLAKLIFQQEVTTNLNELAKKHLNEEVETEEDALKYAHDIIAEWISDTADYRTFIRKLTFQKGIIETKAKGENTVYEMYFDYNEPVSDILGHRVLAINRGEKEKELSVKLIAPIEHILSGLRYNILKENEITREFLANVIEDSYKRLIGPAIEREIRNELTEKAEEGAIKVFGQNLKQLLMQSPLKNKTILALDPGYRNGCKYCVLNPFGDVLYTGVIYPTAPKNDIEGSKKTLMPLIEKYNVEIIAIGNGTASRETENFAVDLIKDTGKKIYYIIVNESGASIYSASPLAAKEFPNFDVALRSAVSIGRRLQDPLAELVKIDPKSIGVGQYQHDMNQKYLDNTLSGVVEDCVNTVGVELNTASPKLLSYVSGISNTIAENIIAYREENESFKSRKELLKVKKLGPKAFEQCGGFLRIRDSKNLLDNTGVHPESYEIAKKVLDYCGHNEETLKGNIKIDVDVDKLSKELEVGKPTLLDIIKELEKPGRDVRENIDPPILRNDVLEMEDLEVGMELKGTVRNVIDFGAFVDIGVHDDGLVHISKMSKRFIKHPLEVVSVGDVVTVKVIDVDLKKKRISLSMI